MLVTPVAIVSEPARERPVLLGHHTFFSRGYGLGSEDKVSGVTLDAVSSSAAIPSSVQQAVNQFVTETKKIIDSLRDDLGTESVPPVIYHYTDSGGLRGIIETGRLWLSDVFSMNDPSELNHGFSIFLDVLKDKAVSHDAQLFAKGLLSFRNRIGIQKSGHYFTCSFSKAGNDLGQWRAYADNGRGYVLGFNTTQLEAAFTQAGKPGFAETSPLAYDDARLRNIHRQIADKLFQFLSLPCNLAAGAEWYTQLSLKALEAGLHFKHPAYINEQEYRFLEAHPIDQPVPDLKFKPHRPYALGRYREFDWRQPAPNGLQQIIIGPAADRHKSHQFAADCVQSFHSGAVPITYSDIPYRV
jgi:hypothetical protein